ncbi:hypothetical protein Vau01_078190 [Virgisporangium aurantiacum]|uniref:Uncharacterized protein n=1 Tax=Virgisporangium aurantiacum TaxID=175570 RepID=A0A8J3ZCG8_9ACTN|nr:hypothetical protein Vau01_078190 [Virgisporangium aurantiacum]
MDEFDGLFRNAAERAPRFDIRGGPADRARPVRNTFSVLGEECIDPHGCQKCATFIALRWGAAEL